MNSKKRILIVDDEQINLEFFEVMLAKLGFDVEKAENGVEALETVKRFKPDLILLDNVMPKLSGWEVTSILKTKEEYREHAETPIIMFSAMDDVKDKVEGLELGADDYITKPFNFSEVLARMRAVLRTRELIHQLEKRENRIKVIEKIVDETADFVHSMRAPLTEISELAGKTNCTEARDLVDRVKQDTKLSLEKLDDLEHRVASLREQAERLKQSETELHAIKKKVR